MPAIEKAEGWFSNDDDEASKEEASALQDHAAAEFITLSMPPLRVGAIRTCQFGMMGTRLTCMDPNCQDPECQGNRVEIHTGLEYYYKVQDQHLYRQPLPQDLELFEPTNASVLQRHTLETDASSGDGSSGSGGSMGGGSGGGGGILDDDADAEGGARGATSSGQGGTAEAATHTRVPLMRCILVHFKTARSKKAISFVLPFVVARSLYRWIVHGRPVLMAGIGGATAHSTLFVSPSNGKPMCSETSFSQFWHKLQQRHGAPWLPTFPPSAMRHIHVGARILNLGEMMSVAAVDFGGDTTLMTNSLKMWEVSIRRETA